MKKVNRTVEIMDDSKRKLKISRGDVSKRYAGNERVIVLERLFLRSLSLFGGIF